MEVGVDYFKLLGFSSVVVVVSNVTSNSHPIIFMSLTLYILLVGIQME